MLTDFNPRTREGCDLKWRHVSPGLGRISIHAPVKGATGYRQTMTSSLAHFNPRTREGCDPEAKLIIAPRYIISIHEPVKGATVCQDGPVFKYTEISIHEPVKGATAFKLAQSLSALSSIILRTD